MISRHQQLDYRVVGFTQRNNCLSDYGVETVFNIPVRGVDCIVENITVCLGDVDICLIVCRIRGENLKFSAIKCYVRQLVLI